MLVDSLKWTLYPFWKIRFFGSESLIDLGLDSHMLDISWGASRVAHIMDSTCMIISSNLSNISLLIIRLILLLS